MRGHGMTVTAASIEHCVFRAIYTRNNAIVQSTAVMLQTCLSPGAGGGGDEDELKFLDDEEVADSTGINTTTVLRPWAAWTREVQANPVYVNLA
jgi:hypothetical protein